MTTSGDHSRTGGFHSVSILDAGVLQERDVVVVV